MGLRPYAPVAIAAFVVAATGVLTNLQGLGAALNLPVQWLRALLGAGPSLGLPFLFVLLLYESLALLVGLVGGTQVGRERPAWAQFGLLWLAVTLFPAVLFNSGWAAGLLWVVVPLALLGSEAVASLVERLLEAGRLVEEGALALLGGLLFAYAWINLAIYTNAPQVAVLARLGLAAILFAGAVAMLGGLSGAATARRGLGLTGLLLLAVVSLSTAWGVSVVRAASPSEPLVVQPTDDSLRIAAAQLAQISTERYREPAVIPLGIQRTLGYAPRWTFRDFETVTLVEGSHPGLPEATLLDAQQPAPPNTIGQRVWLGRDWQWPFSTPGQVLRWLKTREARDGIIERTATLYVELLGE